MWQTRRNWGLSTASQIAWEKEAELRSLRLKVCRAELLAASQGLSMLLPVKSIITVLAAKAWSKGSRAIAGIIGGVLLGILFIWVYYMGE